LIVRAVASSDNNTETPSNANGKTNKQFKYYRARTNGGKRRFTQKMPHDYHVRSVVQLLKNIGQKHGKRENKQ
jgi:hypothetical protein